MICFPNAKINLGLRIIEKRDDGFHNIESLLFPAPLFDVLEYKPSRNFHLKTYGLPIGVKENDNILYKTWKLLNRVYQIPPIEVHLLKNIPAMSGLGGGSSDAAFLIKTANEFFKLGLPVEELKNLATQIGSDCPFFIENKPAIVRCRGDKIELINFSLTGFHLILLTPEVEVSTKNAYHLIKPGKPHKSITEIISQPIEKWQNDLINDFELPVFAKYPYLEQAKKDLYKKGVIYASMTGSGSVIYGIFSEKPGFDSSNFNQLI